jgi:hypothetical protein
VKKLKGAVLVAALVFTAGCGGGSPAEPASSSDSASVAPAATTSAAPTPKEVDAKPYFEALASQDPTAMAAARRAASPGSLAMAYMAHQLNGVNADLDAGYEATVATLSEKGDGFQTCSDDAETGKQNCFTYDKFKVDADGRLAGFSTSGKPLAGRIVLGSGNAVDSPAAKVTLLSAYQTVGGYLVVAVKIRTKGSAVAFFDPVATYRAPNGQQRSQSGQSGSQDFGADSQGTRTFFFKGPLKFGGTMTLLMAPHTGDEYGDSTNVTVKVG